MRILLDTHCWLWWLEGAGKLNGDAVAAVESVSNDIFLSAVSSWEIAIKWRLGRLEIPAPPEEYVPARMADQGVEALPVHHVHALRVASLEAHHGDPFDRLLVAQAMIEGMPLMTADAALLAYPIDVIWAGTRPRPARAAPKGKPGRARSSSRRKS